jgi:hypothetical protein
MAKCIVFGGSGKYANEGKNGAKNCGSTLMQ